MIDNEEQDINNRVINIKLPPSLSKLETQNLSKYVNSPDYDNAKSRNPIPEHNSTMQDLMEKYTNDSANKDIDSVYQKTVFSQSCNHRKTMSTHTQVRFKRVRPKQLSYFKNPFDEFKE